ncbi:MAG: tetratricopeptide repeat protein [Phycisphaerales bacterium JB037]
MNDWIDAEKHVERAHEFYERGRWDDAETELRAALDRNPYQAEWHFNLGLTLEAAGRYRSAVDAFASAHELSKEDPQAALLAGINALRANEAALSLTWLDRAREMEPGSTAGSAHRIRALAQLGEHEQAETEFYLAQQHEAEDAEIHAAMADSLMDRKLWDKAVWCLREAARLDAELPGLQARLAEAHAATGRLERARQLYLAELRNNPGDVDALLDLGELLVRMNRFEEAGEKFRRVLELEPANADAHFELGGLAERRGDNQTALRQYEVVLRLDPSFSEARRRVANLILSQVSTGDLSLVHRLLRMDLRDIQERPESFSDEDIDDLGRLLLDAQLAREAEKLYRLLVERSPEKAEHRHMLAVSLFEAGDRVRGIESCRTALDLMPRHVPAIHNLALAYLEQGQWMRSRYWVRRGLAIAPEDVPLRRLRVRLRLRSVTVLFGALARRGSARR